jgi:hypothetical protein
LGVGVEREDGGVSFRVEGMETAAPPRSQLTHLCNVAWLEHGHERQGLIHRLLREKKNMPQTHMCKEDTVGTQG